MIREIVSAGVIAAAPWQWILPAPKTGAVIEVEDRYGLLSDRLLERWDGFRWVQVSPKPVRDGAPAFNPEGPCVFWRPYAGAVQDYIPGNPSDTDQIAAMRRPKKLSACTTQDAAP